MSGLILVPEEFTLPHDDGVDLWGEVAKQTGHVILRGPQHLLDQIRYVGDGDDPLIHDFEKYLPDDA